MLCVHVFSIGVRSPSSVRVWTRVAAVAAAAAATAATMARRLLASLAVALHADCLVVVVVVAVAVLSLVAPCPTPSPAVISSGHVACVFTALCHVYLPIQEARLALP